MSIVAEVLQSKTKIDVDDISKKVPELKRNVEVLKNCVITNIEDIHIKYKHRYKTDNVMLTKTQQFQQVLNSLKEKADFIVKEDLSKADKDIQANIEELQLIEFKMHAIENLKNLLTLINNFDQEIPQNNFIKCIDIVKELKEIVKQIPPHESLEVMNKLRFKVGEKEHMLQNHLKNIFTSNIEVKQGHEEPINILKIKKHNEEMKMAMLAYYTYREYVPPLNQLARHLWDYVFVPIVNQGVILQEKVDSTYHSLYINVKDANKKSDYKTVFDNLETVLKFLANNFQYMLNDDLTALEYIGNDIRDNLSELIIKNCLRDTVPSTAEDLQKYKIVVEATERLEKTLLEAHIFNADTTSILEYANNVDIHFINKKCEEYLSTATEIMKKDLHDMIEVGVPYNPENPLGHEKLEFPQCSVSKNVQELLTLCEGILQKAIKASPKCSGRLYVTVQHILLKYRTYVPEYHKTYLTTLSQHVALFLNNCQYIAHILIQWNMTYCTQLEKVLVSCDFTSEVAQFPIVGLEIFSNFIDSQIKQINEIMEEAHLDGPTIDKLDPKTEKCIRQCLRQQELLRTVWHKVLAYETYNKNIGLIVNALCKCVISKLVKLEDIPATVAEDLVEAIKLILARAPKLFIDPNEITLYVPLWYKLNELNFVLGASLLEINDRWADKKGPLALQFEGEELKHLIKALFQNTDRRAALLAKIS